MKKPTSLEVLLGYRDYTGDDCALWPLRRNNFGYAEVCENRKSKRAHRVMCEWVNGPAPGNGYYAAHSCGNGHLGCVNPKHLSWKTPSENQQDMVRHGRAKKSGRRQTIPDEIVRRIRELRPTMTLAALSEKFGIKTETIRKIAKGEIRSRPYRHGLPIEPARRTALAIRAKRLRSGGVSLQRISENLDVSRSTVRTLLQEHR